MNSELNNAYDQQASYLSLLAQVRALHVLLQEVAAKAGITELCGVPAKDAPAALSAKLLDEILLSIERKNPAMAAQLQERIDVQRGGSRKNDSGA